MSFTYKCFTISIKNGEVCIFDEFGDLIDIVRNAKKRNIKEYIQSYIDKYFKCE